MTHTKKADQQASPKKTHADHSTLRDHCLPSTISALASRYGVLFQNEPEHVPNRFGGVTRVVRHSLAASQHDHARKALVRMMDSKMRDAA